MTKSITTILLILGFAQASFASNYESVLIRENNKSTQTMFDVMTKSKVTTKSIKAKKVKAQKKQIKKVQILKADKRTKHI